MVFQLFLPRLGFEFSYQDWDFDFCCQDFGISCQDFADFFLHFAVGQTARPTRTWPRAGDGTFGPKIGTVPDPTGGGTPTQKGHRRNDGGNEQFGGAMAMTIHPMLIFDLPTRQMIFDPRNNLLIFGLS